MSLYKLVEALLEVEEEPKPKRKKLSSKESKLVAAE